MIGLNTMMATLAIRNSRIRPIGRNAERREQRAREDQDHKSIIAAIRLDVQDSRTSMEINLVGENGEKTDLVDSSRERQRWSIEE